MTPESVQHDYNLAPAHPGEILSEEFLLPMNITQYRLARLLAWTRAGFTPSSTAGVPLRRRTALLLSRFFGNSAAFWMGLQSQYDLETAEDRLSERLDEVVAFSSA